MPRQKITEGIETAAKELPELTAQQMSFVQAFLSGKNATDAYKASYDASGMSQSTIWAEASRTRNHSEVSAWIDASRMAGLGSAIVTYESHISELERLKTIAVRSGNIGAAVQAEQIRGKAAGLHVEQVRDVTERFDPVSTVRELALMTGIDPHIIAAQHGVTLPDEGATKH